MEEVARGSFLVARSVATKLVEKWFEHCGRWRPRPIRLNDLSDESFTSHAAAAGSPHLRRRANAPLWPGASLCVNHVVHVT